MTGRKLRENERGAPLAVDAPIYDGTIAMIEKLRRRLKPPKEKRRCDRHANIPLIKVANRKVEQSEISNDA